MAAGDIALVETFNKEGAPRFHRVTWVGPSATYLAGGFTGLAAKILTILPGQVPKFIAGIHDVNGYILQYNPTTDKFIVMYYNTDAADGVAIEVPDGTNLAGVTFNFTVACI